MPVTHHDSSILHILLIFKINTQLEHKYSITQDKPKLKRAHCYPASWCEWGGPLDFGVATTSPLVAFSGKVSAVVLIKKEINVIKT